jgi:hypothetical protein
VYTVAVEPWTSYPDDLNKAVEAGTTKVLSPSEELRVKLLAIAYDGVAGVSRISSEGEVIERR